MDTTNNIIKKILLITASEIILLLLIASFFFFNLSTTKSSPTDNNLGAVLALLFFGRVASYAVFLFGLIVAYLWIRNSVGKRLFYCLVTLLVSLVINFFVYPAISFVIGLIIGA